MSRSRIARHGEPMTIMNVVNLNHIMLVVMDTMRAKQLTCTVLGQIDKCAAYNIVCCTGAPSRGSMNLQQIICMRTEVDTSAYVTRLGLLDQICHVLYLFRAGVPASDYNSL